VGAQGGIGRRIEANAGVLQGNFPEELKKNENATAVAAKLGGK
jgi:hypothetical protein